jgi:Na+-translocating ferredoxin:NAD+ oxidoreductase RnfD subunit
MGVGMMMVSTKSYILIVLIALALLQKHFLRYKDIHYFNPSNFALISGLLLFYNKTHIVLGQLGDELWFQVVLWIMALFILIRVDRWLIPLVFIATYILSQYYLVVYYDPMIILDSVIDRFYSVSFILFILFMLTDPKTTPKSYVLEIVFGVLIAFLSTLLDRWYGFRVEHLFEVLFVITPLFALEKVWDKTNFLIVSILLVLSTSAIIYIQLQPPYYFEMDS